MEKTLNFPSAINNVAIAEKLVDEISSSLEFSDEIYGNVLISLVEAVNNAITHGNKEDPDKYVQVCCRFDQDFLSFQVDDQGEGFDFEGVPDPTLEENLEKPDGRGIFIMRHLSDEMKYLSKGNKVLLKFKIK